MGGAGLERFKFATYLIGELTRPRSRFRRGGAATVQFHSPREPLRM